MLMVRHGYRDYNHCGWYRTITPHDEEEGKSRIKDVEDHMAEQSGSNLSSSGRIKKTLCGDSDK